MEFVQQKSYATGNISDSIINIINILGFFMILLAGDLRSPSATDTTERSEMPLTQIPEQKRQASITDIAVEIINPVAKPTLASIGKKASRGQ